MSLSCRDLKPGLSKHKLNATKPFYTSVVHTLFLSLSLYIYIYLFIYTYCDGKKYFVKLHDVALFENKIDLK
jgi:hypothetical protein